MKEKIIATDRDHLKLLIEKEMKQYGNKCNLNHIDTSKVKNLSYLFSNSKFNGDISNWNTSNATDMGYLFYNSEFNEDISLWDVSKVTDMSGLLANSKFNNNISNWNVSNVTNMSYLFCSSIFNCDISSWRPLKIKTAENMFLDCKAPAPYWFGTNNEEIVKKIESYDLFNKINSDLADKNTNIKKMKI